MLFQVLIRGIFEIYKIYIFIKLKFFVIKNLILILNNELNVNNERSFLFYFISLVLIRLIYNNIFRMIIIFIYLFRLML